MTRNTGGATRRPPTAENIGGGYFPKGWKMKRPDFPSLGKTGGSVYFGRRMT
jgi:hypothetical protein